MQYALRAIVLMSLMMWGEAAHALPQHVWYCVDKLTISTQTGSVPLTVEMAQTPLQVEHGLMYRSRVPENTGMIFLFNENAPVFFWMKNTLVSLDILFIDGNGIIRTIKRHATPESLEVIPSFAPVTAVIELAAGEVARLHIAEGDKVNYPHFHE